MNRTAERITVTDNGRGVPRNFYVGDMLVAKMTRSRLRGGNGFTVRLYTSPDEYEIWRTSSMWEATALCWRHAETF